MRMKEDKMARTEFDMRRQSQRKVPRYIGSYVRGSDSEKKLREGPYKDEL